MSDFHYICDKCGGHYGEKLYTILGMNNEEYENILENVCPVCAKDFFESERNEDVLNRSDLYRLEVAKVLINMANIRDSLCNVRRAEKVCLELYNSIMDDDSYLSEGM